MTVLLPSLALSGYRSFGEELALFDEFAKINILIGKNNSGKSNVLRAIKEVLPHAGKPDSIILQPGAVHLPNQPPFRFGIGEKVDEDCQGVFSLPSSSCRHAWLGTLPQRPGVFYSDPGTLTAELLGRKAKHDGTNHAWSITTLPDRAPIHDTWISVIGEMDDGHVQRLAEFLTGLPQSNRIGPSEKGIILNKFPLPIPQHPVELIPAIRSIGEPGTHPIGYDGTGIIDRLAKLEKPSAEDQLDKLKFEAINDFLREVTDRPDARIEIPYARDTILVHMDNKVLPIDCLGSGLHEVIILAAATTTLSNQIICIEEPELHLNPILQKKFIRHLVDRTENQYFVTTHSASIMDTKDAEIYHVTLVDGRSRVERVTTDSSRAAVCEDLGYHPSDLLLANCIIWVEGPSDRLYINWWLNAVDPSLVEGIHFSVMFYGGKLAAHVSNSETSGDVANFIQLRRLNRSGAILIDSDRSSPMTCLNNTKRRLREEFDQGPGFAWITDGREVENYLPIDRVSEAVLNTIPSATRIGGNDRFDNVLKIRRASGPEVQASKVDVAKWITNNAEPDLMVLDLHQQLKRLVAFIRDSNPSGGNAA